ncbi:MAG: hypothetical protein LBG81_03275 [Coriobacteriaceae bacterium]|nr:hypothetical protein [Coriobacteriaceae bacterium]
MPLEVCDPLADFEISAVWCSGNNNPAIPQFLDVLADSVPQGYEMIDTPQETG